ncbi:MAG: ROK family glucokinase [Eubacterium sp.]|nr:ROK family glucokinase [Eubacterium sp.]
MYNIGIDLGGTNIKAGVVADDCRIVGRSNIKTNLPRPAEDIADSIAEAVKQAIADSSEEIDKINSIGMGTPGVADRNSGIVLYSNNLGFENTPLGGMLKERLGTDIYVENDANVAAYGEVLGGAGQGYKNVVVVTLGTGVGGGIIIDGEIYTGFNFCGAELGHTVIEYNGRQCSCGRKGCFEAYSSATALITATKKAMREDKNSRMWAIADNSLDNVDGKTAFDAMRAGDETGTAVVNEYINYLGCGLVNIVNTFQPEMLLIGGGICKEGDYLIKPLEEIIKRESYCINPERSTVLATAKLGNDAGIVGAANLYRLSK